MNSSKTLVSLESPCETGVNIKNIFSSYLRHKGIFSNKDVLLSNFIPQRILHRDNEIKRLSNTLAPILKGYLPSNIFVFGNVGTGKTITTTAVVNELLGVMKDKMLNENIKAIYINCKLKHVADTEYRLLAQILREFEIPIPETGLARNTLYKKFFDVASHKTILLILDEVDELFRKIGSTFFYNLSRGGLKIVTIGISNNLRWRDNLDGRVKSSICEEEIIFPPYNASQLRDILIERSKFAFSIPVDDAVINKCAALAAQENGDARRALELLRVAGEIAERNGENVITEEHVDFAQEKIDSDHIIESIKMQPKQAHIVLSAILERATNSEQWVDRRILSSDLYRLYKSKCESVGLKALTQRRVVDLIEMLECSGVIETKVISRGRYGRTTEIKLILNEATRAKAEKILYENGV